MYVGMSTTTRSSSVKIPGVSSGPNTSRTAAYAKRPSRERTCVSQSRFIGSHPCGKEQGIPGYFRLYSFGFQDKNIIPERMEMNPAHTRRICKGDSITHAGNRRRWQYGC